MKNKDFKRLGDDTKKMEKNAKLYHMGLIVNITIIIIIIILAVIVICFKPNLFSKKEERNIVQANNVKNDEQYTGEIEFSDFKIVSDENNSYIIGKTNEGWKELQKTDNNAVILGFNQNKLYYYDNEKIAYIKFNKDSFNNVDWLKYSQYKISETGETGTLKISKACMVDNNIYFKYSINTVSSSSTGGILKISTSDSSLADATQVIQNVESSAWDYDVNSKTLYYINGSTELHKYDLTTNKDEKILLDVKSFKVEEGHIVYLKINNSYREADNSIVQAVIYQLCLYDINSRQSSIIKDIPVANLKAGDVNDFAQFFSGDLYYLMDNKIIAYKSGANDVIYTHNANDLEGFCMYENNVIELFVQGNKKKYVVSGNLTDNKPKGYTVVMKDGTSKSL